MFFLTYYSVRNQNFNKEFHHKKLYYLIVVIHPISEWNDSNQIKIMSQLSK